jgi:ankyrin repeat protein
MPAHRRFPSACLAALLAAATCICANAGTEQDLVLIDAAGHGDLAAVTRALRDGADVNYSRDNSGNTALAAAAAAGKVEVVRALVAAGAKVNKTYAGGWTPLLSAVTANRLDVVKVLITAKADPDICAPSHAQCRGPLMSALSNANLEMARVLLEGGASVHSTTSYGATPLRFAIWWDGPEHLEMVKALLARGANVDAGHASAYKVSDTGNAPIAWTGEVLITGSRRSAEGTALGDVAARKNPELVKVLLEAGAKVDARQPGWRTPLMLAAIAGNQPVVRLLLDAGADVNAKDSNNKTPLDLALANGRQEVAEMLRNAASTGK